MKTVKFHVRSVVSRRLVRNQDATNERNCGVELDSKLQFTVMHIKFEMSGQ